MGKEHDHSRRVTLSELVTPDMANFHGNMFGGALLSLADKAAYVCGARYCGGTCVTASMDQVNFIEPVHVGELLNIYAQVIYAGRTSVTIEIEVVAEDLQTRETRKVSDCFAYMVHIKDGQPAPVEPLEYEGAGAPRSCLYAKERRKLSYAYRQQIEELRMKIDAMSDAELKKGLGYCSRD